MTRAFGALLILALAAQAGAFPFGGGKAGKASAMLPALRASSASGDCEAVGRGSDEFMAEKPSAAMREEVYGYLARCHEASGAIDKAIGVYTLAHGLYPENTDFADRLGAIYVATGFYSNAVPLFLEVLEARGDDIGANLGLGRAYASLGFLSRAKGYYSRAVILQGFRDAAALEEYTRCMLRKRDWDEVMYISGKGELEVPGSSFWKLAQARAWAGRGDYPSAAEAMDAALVIEDARPLRLERAVYLLLGKKAAAAMAWADRELAGDPGYRPASLLKGMCLYSMGRRAEAGRYFAAARCGKDLTARLAGSIAGVAEGGGCEK